MSMCTVCVCLYIYTRHIVHKCKNGVYAFVYIHTACKYLYTYTRHRQTGVTRLELHAVCCSVVQCVAVCCSVPYIHIYRHTRQTGVTRIEFQSVVDLILKSSDARAIFDRNRAF